MGGTAKNKEVEYINVWDYFSPAYPFNIFLGARGTGKTYSGLKGVTERILESGRRFIYMRRTPDDLATIVDKDGIELDNPYKSLNADLGWNYGIRMINQKKGGIFEREYDEEEQEFEYFGAPIGYAMAMASVAKIRGGDMTDCDYWIYDEFCKEKHVRAMQAECRAFLNAYETIARNREMRGQAPLYVFLFSNSDDIYNEIFKGLGIVHDAEVMAYKGEHHKDYPRRGLRLHLLETPDSFREAKSKTALYRLMEGTDFADMALDNKFAFNDFSLVKYMRVNGMRPVVQLDSDIWIYAMKGQDRMYASYAPAKVRDRFSLQLKHENMRLRRMYGGPLADAYVEGRIYFESYDIKMRILEAIL